MINDANIQKGLEYLVQEDKYLPSLSVDCTIFGFHNGSLKILLLKYHDLDKWSIPGGFVYKDENISDAAKRILSERTRLQDIFMDQFHTFGNKDRTEDNIHKILLQNQGIDLPKDHWIFQRFATVAYCSIIDFTLYKTAPDIFNEVCEWIDVNDLPKMGLDHEEIVKRGLKHIKKNLDTNIVVSNLLPEKFTMNELQSIYETILNEKFRRNNFQRKILGFDILERMEKHFDGSANKAPYLYKFKQKIIEL